MATTKTNIKANFILTIAAIGVIGLVFGKGALNRESPVDENHTKDKEIRLEVRWDPSPQVITISYKIDGKPILVDNVPRYSEWTQKFNVSSGTKIELKAEHGYTGGYLQCVIYVNDKIVNYEHRNDAGDCNISYVVD